MFIGVNRKSSAHGQNDAFDPQRPLGRRLEISIFNRADGLAWIDLTVLRDPSLVPQTVAQTLGLREQADRPFSQQVRAFLQDKQCLLLLDNFEQVLYAADFVADLLVSCPRLQVLVTSRAPLHLRAEQQLVLTPLTQAAAVTLFRERAHGVQPNLAATEPSVAAIGEQVYGIVLAMAVITTLAAPPFIKLAFAGERAAIQPEGYDAELEDEIR